MSDNVPVEEKSKRLYGPDGKGRWPCPGGYCVHYKCIVEYETTYVGKRYLIK